MFFRTHSQSPSTPRRRRVGAKTKKAVKGFSLIESMVSAALLTISVMGTFQAYSQATDYRENVRNLTQATNVAEGVLEDLILRFNGDSDLDIGPHGPMYFDRDGEFQSAVSEYTATWTVVPNTAVDGIRTIEVDVQWTSKLGTRNLKLATERP